MYPSALTYSTLRKTIYVRIAHVTEVRRFSDTSANKRLDEFTDTSVNKRVLTSNRLVASI